MKSLNRKQAQLLLPAIVDGEASEEERKAFFDFIGHHPDIQREYEQSVHIKHLLKHKLQRKKAPDHLKSNIMLVLDSLPTSEPEKTSKEIEFDVRKKTDSRPEPNIPARKDPGTTIRYISAAAIILFITLVTLQILDQTTRAPSVFDAMIVENVAAQHFIAASLNTLQTLIDTHSPTEAEQYLSEQHGMTITVPEINGAVLSAITSAAFVNNYEVPLLTYEQPEIGEVIYIFVLDVDDISEHNELMRHHKAKQNCKQPYDYYVAEIEDHHVVSWLWDNNWYTAVSNHNGYDLASLIGPLNPN